MRLLSSVATLAPMDEGDLVKDPKRATGELAPGLHESLITQRVHAQIERARELGLLIEVKNIDDVAIAEILARHVHDAARERIAGIPASTSDRKKVQVRASQSCNSGAGQ